MLWHVSKIEIHNIDNLFSTVQDFNDNNKKFQTLLNKANIAESGMTETIKSFKE